MARYHVELAPARGTGQDRAAVFERGDRLVIALADGAGGTSQGAAAAQAFVDAVAAASTGDWRTVIEHVDRAIAGQTTAIVAEVAGDRVIGASAGDSEAWLVTDADVLELTRGQQRKPLVGSGCAAVPFHAPLAGTLLVASDGLFRYANPGDIARVARGEDLAAAAHALVALVRLPSGGLQDDVSIVLARA